MRSGAETVAGLQEGKWFECDHAAVERICVVDVVVLYNVFLIGYGVVAGFNVGDEKPPHD
jgi:hypothetical protein